MIYFYRIFWIISYIPALLGIILLLGIGGFVIFPIANCVTYIKIGQASSFNPVDFPLYLAGKYLELGSKLK